MRVLRNVGQGKTMEVPNKLVRAAPTSAKELTKVIRFIDNEEYGLYQWFAREAAADMNSQERFLSIPEKPENWICIRL